MYNYDKQDCFYTFTESSHISYASDINSIDNKVSKIQHRYTYDPCHHRQYQKLFALDVIKMTSDKPYPYIDHQKIDNDDECDAYDHTRRCLI